MSSLEHEAESLPVNRPHCATSLLSALKGQTNLSQGDAIIIGHAKFCQRGKSSLSKP